MMMQSTFSCDVDVSAAVRIKPFSQAGSSARSIHIYVRTALAPHTLSVAQGNSCPEYAWRSSFKQSWKVSLRLRFPYEQARTDRRVSGRHDRCDHHRRPHHDRSRRDGQSCRRVHNHRREVRSRFQSNRRRAIHSPDSHNRDRNSPRPPDSAKYRPSFGRAPRSCKLAHFAAEPLGPAWLEARPALTRTALRKLPAYYTALRNRRCYGWAAHRSRNRQAPLRVRESSKALESAVTCESLHRLRLDHDCRHGCKAHARPQTLLPTQALAANTG